MWLMVQLEDADSYICTEKLLTKYRAFVNNTFFQKSEVSYDKANSLLNSEQSQTCLEMSYFNRKTSISQK